MVLKLCDRPEHPLSDGRAANHVWHRKDVLLDFGSQAQQAHDLGDASPGDALAAGDLGLIANLAGFEKGLPLKGLAEKLDDPGRPGALGGFELLAVDGSAFTVRSAATCRVRVPTLPSSKAPLGAWAISRFFSR